MMTRRNAIKATALASAACAAAWPGRSQPAAPAVSAAPAATGPFTLPPLPYAYDALEPHLDQLTMQIHHDKHHQAYVTGLNKAVTGHPELEKLSVEELVRGLNGLPEGVRTVVQNMGGGHYNHWLFWQMMKPGGGGEPKGELAGAIDKKFNNFAGFTDEFTKAASGRFGSGWAWLVLGPGKELSIESSANQDSPLAAGKPVLLGIDVWEHAYYLKYQNRRPDYIAAFFKLINWDFVADRYNKLKV